MQSGASKKKAGVSRTAKPALLWAILCVVPAMLGLAGMSSRLHILMNYRCFATAGLPVLEPLLANSTALLFCCLLGAAWIGLFYLRSKTEASELKWPMILMALAAAPFLLVVTRTAGIASPAASVWEPIWSCMFVGLSFAKLGISSQTDSLNKGSLVTVIVACSCALAAIWWYAQTVWYYDCFLLGFNEKQS